MRKFNKDKYLRKLKSKRYWQNNSRYFYMGIPCLLCLVLGIYFAYSKFFVASEEEVVRTTVGEFIYGDIIMTPYIDGEYSSTFPEKKTGINVEKVICDGDVSASWEDDKWGLYVTNLSKRTKCSVYFVTPNSCGINDNVSCINSREGLATLANEVNNGDNKSGKIIYLTSDLDLGGKFDSDGNALDGNISWTPIGTDSNPFSGTFDGNGHIISNMYISLETDAALFISINYATIKNLGINNSYIMSKDGVAATIGANVSYSVIENNYVDAIIIGKKNSGGILGATSSNIIKNCYSLSSINGSNSQFIGGIVGYFGNSVSKLKNCYNYGNLIGGYHTGGIVGGLQGSIEHSYNIGKINSTLGGGIVGQLYVYSNPKIYYSYNYGKINSGGGVIGQIYGSDNTYSINGNYYLNDSASNGIYNYSSSTNVEPLSQEEMPSVISVINGDNAFVEDTNNINNGYPILKWQAERENN